VTGFGPLDEFNDCIDEGYLIERKAGQVVTLPTGHRDAILANALFQTACRFDELIQLKWEDRQAVEKETVALRIKGKGSVFQDVPVPGRLSQTLLDWKAIQERFKGRRNLAPGGIAFGITVCVCGVFGGSVFQPRVQPSPAGASTPISPVR
jgi:integrase